MTHVQPLNLIMSTDPQNTSPLQISTTMASCSLPAFSDIITVKLTVDNYSLWSFQVSPNMKSQGFFGFVDGLNPMPTPSLDGTVDPTLEAGQIIDQLGMAILTSSLAENVLSQPRGKLATFMEAKVVESQDSHAVRV